MNPYLHRSIFSLLCVAVAIAGLPLRASADEADAAAPKSGGIIRKLETQQGGESRKLGKVAGDVAWLLDDLKSNGLLEQGGGKKMETFKTVIHSVANTSLPATAAHLRNARLERDATRHHMTSADEEVDEILSQLGTILAGSSALLAEEHLIKELKDMIKVQTTIRGQTAEWGKAMLISPETAGAGKGPLMQDQAAMLNRYQKFLEKLIKTSEDAVDDASKSRLQQAERALNPAPPAIENKDVQKFLEPEPTTGDVLQATTEQIEGSDVLAAVGAQDRAIASFKTALQILSAGQFELADFVAGLEKLIEKQKILRADTETEQDLDGKRSFYEARQIEIQDAVTDFTFEAPDLFVSKDGEFLVEPLMISLTEAVDSLKAAEKEKAMASQDTVITLLESVYGTATEALEEEEGDPFWADSPAVPEESWKLPDDGEEEDDEEEDEDFPEIFEGLTSAELMVQPDNTTEGAQADAETAMAANRFLNFDEEGSDDPPDYITDEGPPSVGQDKAPDAPGGKGEGNTNKVEKDRLARDSMQRQRQKAKVQDYVRQLPPEFRRQVSDYYELIAE